MDLISAISLRTLRRLAERVGAYDEDDCNALLLDGCALRIIRVVLYDIVVLANVSSVTEGQDLARDGRQALRSVIITVLVVRRARNATATNNVVSCLNGRLISVVGRRLITSASLTHELCRRVPGARLNVRLARRRRLGLNVDLLLNAVGTN